MNKVVKEIEKKPVKAKENIKEGRKVQIKEKKKLHSEKQEVKEERKIEKVIEQTGKKTEEKTVEKSEIKKKEIKETRQTEKKTKEKVVKKVKVKIIAPAEVKRLREKIKKKSRMKFRGRFGNQGIRKKSNKKWQKWRYPRGIDVTFKRENHPIPMIGRGTVGEIIGVHPSGYREKLIHNPFELHGVEKNIACRIASTVGRKKRLEIVKKAEELQVKVLNA